MERAPLVALAALLTMKGPPVVLNQELGGVEILCPHELGYHGIEDELLLILLTLMSAITASFDYVYERLGGHDGFLEWARFSPTNTTKFYEWRSKQLQKESVSDSSEGKIVINVLNYHNDADSIQLPAEGLPTPTVPSV